MKDSLRSSRDRASIVQNAVRCHVFPTVNTLRSGVPATCPDTCLLHSCRMHSQNDFSHEDLRLSLPSTPCRAGIDRLILAATLCLPCVPNSSDQYLVRFNLSVANWVLDNYKSTPWYRSAAMWSSSSDCKSRRPRCRPVVPHGA